MFVYLTLNINMTANVRNVGVSLRNMCCTGKTISFTYSECVFECDGEFSIARRPCSTGGLLCHDKEVTSTLYCRTVHIGMLVI
jgi:hypothetical protein